MQGPDASQQRHRLRWQVIVDVVFKSEASERLLWTAPGRQCYANGRQRLRAVRNATLYPVVSGNDLVPGLVRVKGTAEVTTTFDVFTLWRGLAEVEPDADWPCDVEDTFWSRRFPGWFAPRRVPQQFAPDQRLPFDAVVPVDDIEVCFLLE